MSDILIKGMKMPSIDLEWRIIRGQDGKWYAIDVNAETSDGEWHEIVPVPPHGRLIDADALMKILSKVIDINASIEQRNEATDQERRCLWWFEQQIGIAPTIIPAEEGE